jgi:hypothetical protein
MIENGSSAKENIIILMDWTDCGNVMCLVASIPHRRRVLPIWGEVIQKGLKKGSQNMVEEEAIRGMLGSLSPQTRRRVIFVADKGFAKPGLCKTIELCINN